MDITSVSRVSDNSDADSAKKTFEKSLADIQKQTYNLNLEQAENVLKHKATESKAEQAAATGSLRSKFSFQG